VKRSTQLTPSLLLLGSAAAPIAAAQNTDVSGDPTAWDVAARLHEQTHGRNL